MPLSFELSDEQKEIRDWVHDFAEREIRPVAHQYDESEEFPWDVVKKAAKVGLYSVDFIQQTYADETGLLPALVAEELTWGCAGIALAITGTQLPVAAIFGQGTPEQIAEWIPKCYGSVENPSLGDGSDVSSMNTFWPFSTQSPLLRTARGGDHRDRMRHGIRAFIEACARQRELAKVLLVESVGVSERLEAARHEVQGRFAAMVEEEVRHAEHDAFYAAIDPVVFGRAVVGAVNEATGHFLGTPGADPSALADGLCRIFAP